VAEGTFDHSAQMRHFLDGGMKGIEKGSEGGVGERGESGHSHQF